jgi:hypothetical protein
MSLAADIQAASAGPNASRDFRPPLLLDNRNVVLTLQVEPELRAVAKIATESHRGVSRNGAAAAENAGNTAGRHAEIERKAVCAQPARLQFALEQTPPMCRRLRA